MHGNGMHKTGWIGTSGWHYPAWEGSFYPRGIRQDEYLAYYTQSFQTVEINNTFYKLPTKAAIQLWRDSVPEGFLFAVKGSRYITHMKKLLDAETHLPKLLGRIKLLGNKLGPIVFQLPARFHYNPDRLRSFLEALPTEYRFALELRNPSWYRDEVWEALSSHQVAFCVFDLAGRFSPKIVTSHFAYIRLHGPKAQKYSGHYSTKQLEELAELMSSWKSGGRDVYCYFDNTGQGEAVQDALKLSQIMTGH